MAAGFGLAATTDYLGLCRYILSKAQIRPHVALSTVSLALFTAAARKSLISLPQQNVPIDLHRLLRRGGGS